MTTLPETAPGHWDTPEGREIAVEYLAKGRHEICMGDVSDFHLANKQYLEDVHVGAVTFQTMIHVQTAAKERIRWLSVHLANAQAKLADNPMKTLIREMFTGWILYEKSWNPETREYERDTTDCMIEACGGDYVRGVLLHLFDYWANDIQSMAPHLGLALERCFAGQLYINEEIPPAPAPDYWWFNGAWQAPGFEPEGEEPSDLCSIAVAAPRGERSDDSKPRFQV